MNSATYMIHMKYNAKYGRNGCHIWQIDRKLLSMTDKKPPNGQSVSLSVRKPRCIFALQNKYFSFRMLIFAVTTDEFVCEEGRK